MLSLKGALALYGLCLASLLAVGGSLAAYGALGLAAAEWLCVGLPVIAAFAVGPERAAHALRLLRPRPAAWIGAALAGSSAWLVIAFGVSPFVEAVLPMPPELMESLERAARPEGPLWLPLLTAAVTPAICEELLCRGALLPALHKRYGRWIAVLASAALFAALHVSLYRFVPTLLLGISFGWLALASGSTLPAMLAHALNNGAIVILASDEGRQLREALEAHPAVAVVGSVGVLTVGHLLVSKRGGR